MEEVVRRIVAVGDPERVILFGSRARGDARPDSDIDLLIVQETDDPPARRSLAIRRALRGIPVGKDVIVYTPEEFADWMGASLSLAGRAAREGKDL
jgi:predicted nucleotidyltransferase